MMLAANWEGLLAWCLDWHYGDDVVVPFVFCETWPKNHAGCSVKRHERSTSQVLRIDSPPAL